MDRKKDFQNAAKKVLTYGQVMIRLNDIAKQSGNSEAYFTTELADIDTGTQTGFKFSSAAQAQSLSQLLNDLGIAFICHHSGLDVNVGELYISPAHVATAQKIFNNWSSWIIVEPRVTGNQTQNTKWAQPIFHTR